MKAEKLKDEFLEYFNKPVTTWKGRPVMVDAKAGGLTLISFWVRDEEVTEQTHNFNKEKNTLLGSLGMALFNGPKEEKNT